MSYPGSYSITCPVYGGGSPAAPVPRPRAGFDAAKTTDENRKHWANADNLAPVSQLTPQIRALLRNRARYECLNNSFAAGAVRTLVNDTVGKGPRLQMETDDDKLNDGVESLWWEWAAASDFALNMRVLAGVRFVAGECFGVYHDSKRLERLGLPVSLDIRLTEPDQVAHPYGQNWLVNGTGDDGIVCDEGGEVVGYKILRAHPGDQRAFLNKTQADNYSADDVIHWFVPERPGQLRGFTPLAPGLPVFAQLRRFTTATLTAAEVAAMLAGVLESDLPMGGVDNNGAPVVAQEQYFDTIEMVRGMLLTLPPGTKASQFKPEQPTTNYSMFVGAKLRELGRAINMPYGKIAGDHSSYNYSSGKLDDSPYWADRDIERQGLESKTFNPFFYRWCDFARFALPRLAAYKGKWWSLKHSWTYDARPTADPVKDATADEINLTNASDSLAAIANRDGTTEDALIASRARTQRKFIAAGLTPPAWLVAGAAAPTRQGDGIPQDTGASRD